MSVIASSQAQDVSGRPAGTPAATVPPPADTAIAAAPPPAGGAPALSAAASGWHAFLLRKAAQQISSQAESVLGPRGLTLRHFGLMLVVEEEPGANQRLIGQRIRVDRTTIVGIVDDLEAAGLLSRDRGADRRAFALRLTERGADELAELKALLADVHREFLAPLTVAERMMLRDLLGKIVTG